MPRTHLLYDFYRKMSKRFYSLDDLLRHALPIMAEYLDAQRISFFNWEEDKSIISLQSTSLNGENFELQENIFVDKDSPEIAKFLQDGLMDSPTLDYPVIYALVKWRTPLESLKALTSGQQMRSRYGVLRFERFKKSKEFTQSDKQIILGLCSELSSKINVIEIDSYHMSQLERARALNGLAKLFASSLRLADSLKEILKSIQNTFHFDRTSMYLLDPKTQVVNEAYSADLSGEVKSIDVSKNMHRAFLAHCPGGEYVCPLITSSDIVLSLPLSMQSNNLGWLVFDNMLSRAIISQEDILSLKQFSTQIALAIDNARLFEKVQELSNYDELTKLCLRRFFNENLSQEIYRSQRFNLTLAIILLDIDHFKTINDSFGHIFGDEALKEVSKVIRTSLRQTDIPCRYGGDEIIIMLPRTTAEEAKHIAKRLSQKVRDIKMNPELTKGQDVHLSISQGIAVYPYDSQEQADLIHCADEALYSVKEGGRGFWASYSDIKNNLKEKDKKED